MTDFAVYVVFLAVNVTVIVLRRRRPDLPRPFAVRGTIHRVPLIPVLGLASVAGMMTQLELLAIALGTALFAAGLAAGWVLPLTPMRASRAFGILTRSRRRKGPPDGDEHRRDDGSDDEAVDPEDPPCRPAS